MCKSWNACVLPACFLSSSFHFEQLDLLHTDVFIWGTAIMNKIDWQTHSHFVMYVSRHETMYKLSVQQFDWLKRPNHSCMSPWCHFGQTGRQTNKYIDENHFNYQKCYRVNRTWKVVLALKWNLLAILYMRSSLAFLYHSCNKAVRCDTPFVSKLSLLSTEIGLRTPMGSLSDLQAWKL